ncbi:TetR/AcrR family transcriptional regulator [Nisaea acidiphila]|uniref:TetR/AcrR family transcriptional regulator n=1 Tax=Nisaea acidiphila TaxID=1862145 RepID=A0A9J7AUU8_9PROT|nr:TetR/AcrR family transcriptional regulator [Nisaea acidiphila]UUX51104.1 TetR/AcrR family transcriptional regulator [Nisaea acidiphila]
MARPSKFDRDEAIETAMEAFWRDGYESCSVKALSERLGITRSSFYNAFNSREDLFAEVLERYARQSPDRAFADLVSDGQVRALITRTFRLACRVRAADPDGKGCLAVKSVDELCGRDRILGPLLEEAILGNVARIERLLEFGKETGELPESLEPHATALALKAQLVGLNVICKVIRDETELRLAAETALRGLGLFEEATDA